MNKKLPPLNALKAFESAARHLNFTKAADDLFVTQAAVSHQIKLLEDFLGVPLFYRRNRLLELTEIGRQYFEEIQPLFQQIALSTEKIKLKNSRQILSISTTPSFGMHWLVPRLNEFHHKYPDIEIRLVTAAQDEGLLGKDIDVAIYYGSGNWQNLEAVKLVQARIMILASHEYLQRNPMTKPEDLTGKNLIHVCSHTKWKQMVEYLQLTNVDTESGPMYSNTSMAIQAAKHSQGVVVANCILAQAEINEGSVIEPFATEVYDEKAFYVVYPTQMSDIVKVQHFVEWITQEIEGNYK
ncbi:transcriptional regulator GcvA [[Haemophilus] ducreyi]|uniref:transcriptional regulator GcvA n=1 Tax=Haemophilus ducreyi TaxID=730 RepID=UPI000654DF7A|nr:transcriptional regulator GcvA [[Haemophilus] ducreyi]AKO45359.1 transcriptional regulator [[Haemophilus] ducreyi]AKO46744.1 transcriptional regulator [[Haemophilus] ducreyi]AKO48084.1 transcriptional regulator [[Haemophilus] ducreyi]AKO49470.1 transcriptional regulator [[Haemophilus] ducreyi]ANF61493.1 transcriptional regulator [[Haemophilus] ducreyi]